MANGCVALCFRAAEDNRWCVLNAVLAEIERTGAMNLSSGETILVRSHVGPGSGRVIRLAVEVAKPKPACEAGLECEVNMAQLVSLRKCGHDLRSFAHFIPL